MLLLFALLLPSPTWAAIALVTHTCATQIGGGDGTDLTSTSIDSTGANLFVLYLTFYDPSATDTATVADTHTGCASPCNTWHAQTNQNNNQTSSHIIYAWNASYGTSHTFTLKNSGSLYNGAFCVVAFSGVQTSSDPVDQQDVNANSAGTTIQPSSGTITPTAGNELVFTSVNGAAQSASFTISPSGDGSTGYLVIDQALTDAGLAIAYIIQTAATGTNPTWTTEGLGWQWAAISTFKAAAGAAARRPGHAMVLQ